MKNSKYYNFMFMLCTFGFFACFGANIFDIGVYVSLKPLVYLVGILYGLGAYYYRKAYISLCEKKEKASSRRPRKNFSEYNFYPRIRKSI